MAPDWLSGGFACVNGVRYELGHSVGVVVRYVAPPDWNGRY